jgi:hypothetical protein
MRERSEALAPTDHVVVFAIPLLRPVHRERLGFPRGRRGRLPGRGRRSTGWSRRAGWTVVTPRPAIAAQISREERLAGADFVVDNSSSVEHLDAEVARPVGLGRGAQGADPGLRPPAGFDTAGRYHP